MPNPLSLRSLCLCVSLLIPAALPAETAPAPAPSPPPAAAPASPGLQRAVHEGVAVEAAVLPLSSDKAPLLEGDHARVRFRVTDVHTGTPLSGLYPAGWMDRLPAAREEDPEACRKKVQGFLGGSLLSRPEVDLNLYYVLALNDDATISVVDPLFGYGNSKLLSMVFLKSRGEDWALTADGARLFVSLPDSDRVAVVETADWNVVTEIQTRRRPGRLVLQPDGRQLWVAWEGGVSAINTRALRVAGHVETGKGSHDLAFSDDSRFLFVTNEAAGTVSVIETDAHAKRADVAVGPRPISVAWSAAARAAYVVSAGDGAVAAIRPGETAAAARAVVSPGLGAIRFAPGGRLGFVVHPEKNQVHILDAATHRFVQTADVEPGPNQVAFSDELAYIRHSGSPTVLMIPLKTVGEAGRPVPVVDFPGGQHPAGAVPVPTPADGMVQAPGAVAMLVANAEDKAIYFYKEGMAAPMGHFVNYGKKPRAVLVVDRSLNETEPGVYETTVRLGRSGAYDLALLLDSPRISHCFPLQVAANPRLAKKAPLAIQVRTDRPEVPVGEEVRVRLKISDADGLPKTGLRDVRTLAFLSPGMWQTRPWATEVGDGEYEVRFSPPEAGLYYVFVEVASAGMPFQKSPSLTFWAVAPGKAPQTGGTK